MKTASLWLLWSGLVVIAAGCAAPEAIPSAPPARWWKGNTHTHSLWSDGDAAPEWIADWYKNEGYHFLVLSDHNILSEGEKWFPVTPETSPRRDKRLTPQRLQELREKFGEDRILTRTNADGEDEMRLWTLDQLRQHFEEPGRFLFIQGEEITDRFQLREVHVNGLNLQELIPPQGGESLRQTLNRNVDAVAEQSRRLGQPMLAHINHPNFRWSLTWEDIASVTGDRFFEVYNGHPGVRNYGDEKHLSTERMWDLALTQRLSELGLEILFGVATDDSHGYFTWGVGKVNPGRGWVMVRTEELDARSIVEAMQAGEFYASSGVTLRDFECDGRSYGVEIDAEEGVTYTTYFIGTRLIEGAPGEIGEVLERWYSIVSPTWLGDVHL